MKTQRRLKSQQKYYINMFLELQSLLSISSLFWDAHE